ncbi:MAG: hypothetical protein IJP90_16165 [Treponema sp.]|nr:hypothetical protein [Treponema sp.]
MKKFCFFFLVSISFLFLSCQSTKIDLPKNDDEISIFKDYSSDDKYLRIQQIFLTDEKNGSYRAEFSQTHSFINKKKLSVKKICKNIQQNKYKPLSLTELRPDYSKFIPPAYEENSYIKEKDLLTEKEYLVKYSSSSLATFPFKRYKYYYDNVKFDDICIFFPNNDEKDLIVFTYLVSTAWPSEYKSCPCVQQYTCTKNDSGQYDVKEEATHIFNDSLYKKKKSKQLFDMLKNETISHKKILYEKGKKNPGKVTLISSFCFIDKPTNKTYMLIKNFDECCEIRYEY